MLALAFLIFKYFCSEEKVHLSLHWVMILLMTKSDNLFQLESHLQACSHCWAFTPRTTISERKGLLQDAGYSDKIQLIHLCAKLTIFLLPLSPRSLHKNLSLSTVRHLFSPFRKNISLIQETGLIKLVAPVMILLYLVWSLEKTMTHMGKNLKSWTCRRVQVTFSFALPGWITLLCLSWSDSDVVISHTLFILLANPSTDSEEKEMMTSYQRSGNNYLITLQSIASYSPGWKHPDIRYPIL